MSENVKLADLMKEKLEEEKASKEVAATEEVAVAKEEPKTESQEPKLKDLIRQMLVDMQRS